MPSSPSSATGSEERNSGSRRRLGLHRADGFFQGQFQAMGSPCELLVETEDEALAQQLLQLVASEAWRVEDKFSRYLPDNAVAGINGSNGRPVTVDEETANLLDFAAILFELSEQRFDITSGILRKAWHFDGSDRVPKAGLVRRIVRSIGWQKVEWQRPEIRLPHGMQIDFGGVGKEYAVDNAARILAAHTDCPCLVNFGGDLVATGRVRSPRGWQVGIESVTDSNGVQKLIRLSSGALATSGDARRYVLRDGVRYGHILDPLSGWPVEHAPRSVTVAASTCTQAGMLATLAMLRGADAEAFLEKQDVQFWCQRQGR